MRPKDQRLGKYTPERIRVKNKNQSGEEISRLVL